MQSRGTGLNGHETVNQTAMHHKTLQSEQLRVWAVKQPCLSFPQPSTGSAREGALIASSGPMRPLPTKSLKRLSVGRRFDAHKATWKQNFFRDARCLFSLLSGVTEYIWRCTGGAPHIILKSMGDISGKPTICQLTTSTKYEKNLRAKV